MRVFFLILMLMSFLIHLMCVAYSLQLTPAIYVFGDSLFDSGNNNILPTLAKANYIPYGHNFPKGITGRFTNGRTVADFIAEMVELPYSPPYMSIRTSPVPVTGLNYASGSCGILSETGSQLGKCLNIKEQVDLFERTAESVLSRHFKNSKTEFEEYLGKSIFLFSVGSNDYINNYLLSQSFPTSKNYLPQEFAKHLVDTLARQFERLYKIGMRKVIAFEVGPIGFIPSIAKQQNKQEKSVEEINQLVLYFNDNLQSMFQNLTTSLQGSTFAIGHIYWLANDVIKNPSTYGLIDTSDPCCTTWENGTSACIPLLKPCQKPDNHFFWDGFHLSEALYSLIAARCFNDSSVCSPFINHLVQI